jgi:hypothetical protein
MLAWENNSLVETVNFDYDAIDGKQSEANNVDDSFWHLQGELLVEILRFLTVPKTLAGRGQRVSALALYLNPSLIDEKSLKDIEKLEDAQCSGTALSKALLTFQQKFNAHRGYFQKAAYLSETYRRSAIVAHEQRKQNGNGQAKGKPCEIEYLRAENRRLAKKLQEIEDSAIIALKERSAKGGRAHKGTAFAKRRAKKAAKARHAKPKG